MTTHVVNEFHALPDRADDVMNLLVELCPVTRARPGCEAISLRRNQDDPTNIVGDTCCATVRITTTISRGEPSPATPRSSTRMLAEPMSVRYVDEVRAW